MLVHASGDIVGLLPHISINHCAALCLVVCMNQPHHILPLDYWEFPVVMDTNITGVRQLAGNEALVMKEVSVKHT